MPPLRTVLLIGYKAGSDALGRLAVFAVLMVATRTLAPEAVGQLALFTTIGWLACALGDGGLQLYAAGQIARHTAEAGAWFWPVWRLRLVTAVCTTTVVGAIAVAVAPDNWLGAWLIANALIVTSTAEAVFHGFRGLGRSDLESGLMLAQRVTALGLAAVALHLAPSLTTLGLALGVPAVGGLATAAWWMRRLAPPGTTRPHAVTWTVWRQQIAPVGLGILLSVAYYRVDVLLLSIWVPLEDVAAYGAVYRLLEAFRLLPAAVLAVVLPHVFGADGRRFTTRLAVLLGGAGVLATAVVWPMAAPLVRLAYGDTYVVAAPVLQLLTLSLPWLALNMALTHRLVAAGQQTHFAATACAALLANLALNVGLIPTMGPTGAALATVITEGVVTTGCLLSLYWPRTAR